MTFVDREILMKELRIAADITGHWDTFLSLYLFACIIFKYKWDYNKSKVGEENMCLL